MLNTTKVQLKQNIMKLTQKRIRLLLKEAMLKHMNKRLEMLLDAAFEEIGPIGIHRLVKEGGQTAIDQIAKTPFH